MNVARTTYSNTGHRQTATLSKQNQVKYQSVSHTTGCCNASYRAAEGNGRFLAPKMLHQALIKPSLSQLGCLILHKYIPVDDVRRLCAAWHFRGLFTSQRCGQFGVDGSQCSQSSLRKPGMTARRSANCKKQAKVRRRSTDTDQLLIECTKRDVRRDPDARAPGSWLA